MDMLLAKQDHYLIAAYDSDFEKLQKIKPGETVLCKITRPRNIKFHRKYFALLNMVFQNQEVYTDLNDLRHDLIIEAGFYTLRPNIHGEEVKKADSICFASMDEDTFQDLYNKTIDVIIRWFRFDKQEILDNVEQFF